MANWKKIVVSGSNISQLNNDSGYLASTGTIDSASVAARATTLSPEATASIADRATTASFADLAGSIRSGLTASHADRATSASIADALSQLATASHALTAVTASHALNVPATASHALTAVTASIADELSGLATASIADTATTASQTAGTASFADLASSARNADSASVAARATTLSSAATASFADVAGTVHDGNITAAKLASDAVTTAKILDSNVTNAKLQNDSVTLGSTEVELGATTTTLTGLTEISAQTGSFVLQVFESSSTIITSGSNIFGDKQNDIQQFTGSILQTGSFTTTGTVTADKVSSDKFSGSFSGSFQGDGSNLSGIATSLTVDGDSGTQNVSLTDDDLQIIGTSNEIETAVTKVGTDVKVTLGLPNTVDVTASIATRANGLAPTVTASQADNATTASFADLAGALRTGTTASFADRATSASIADKASTLSATATASQADNATTASHAVTAASASAIIAGAAFPTSQGLEGQALLLNSSKDFVFGDAFGTGSTKKLNQSSAASTWSFAHNLNEPYPIIQAYDSNGDQLIPERIEAVNANNAKLYFATNTAGVAAAMVGGMGISASQATQADTASVALRANSLAPTVTASIADTATSASHTFGTASIANDATTASFAETGDGVFSGSFSGSFQGDGSDLTGIATTLTVDGDSGTQDVSLTADDLQIIGTAQEIETAVTKVGTDVKVTVGLPNNVTIGNDLTVTNNATIAGDLVVDGSIVSASSLAVEDQFIILASGSNGAIDGGIIVNQVDDHPDGKGVAFAYDSSTNRWALETGLNDTASVITPDAHMGVIQENAGAPGSAPTYGGTAGKGTILIDTNNDEAYIYV